MKPMKIKSGFALLDVLGKGRHKLAKHFKKAPIMGPVPDDISIPVVIVGRIIHQHSNDDGTSIEFSVDVSEVWNGQPGDKTMTITAWDDSYPASLMIRQAGRKK